MESQPQARPGPARGKRWTLLCLFTLLALGAWLWGRQWVAERRARPVTIEAITSASAAGRVDDALFFDPANAARRSSSLTRTTVELPALPPAGSYLPKDNVVELELSEYAGYCGLILANGGLEPTENSEFFKRGGFKVKITLSEAESRDSLHQGKVAALATTVDVLPTCGREFHAVVPAQIGFSRGADGVVVRREIQRANDLKGRVLATARFTEADFFARFLAQEVGLQAHVVSSLTDPVEPDALNLLYCPDTFAAGDLFLDHLQKGGNRLAGCVTWAPKTTEIAERSRGEAQILVSSHNLLIVADILVVNRGFAQQHPDKVAALVAGLLEGNRRVRENPEACLEVAAKAFGWSPEKTRQELAKVHFANLPENRAFFSGALETGGTFAELYRLACRAYGDQLPGEPLDGGRFLDLRGLDAAERSGAFTNQIVAISPLRSAAKGAGERPLLSKDIRFLFEPNSFTLPVEVRQNQRNLEALRWMLQIAPGSTVLLRGHVDNSKSEAFRKEGGEKFLRQMTAKAMELSLHRALEIKRLLIERFDLDAARIEAVGRGWDEPAGRDPDRNRRVEAQWFIVP